VGGRPPGAYDAAAAAERAYASVVGTDDGLRTMVEACSAWPPGARRWPRLDDLVAAARWDAVEALLEGLAATAAPVTAPSDLAEQLGPWLAASRAAGAAGVLACRVLRDGAGEGDLADDRIDDLLAARRELEAEFADVARGAVLALVDAALEHLGVTPVHSLGDGATVSVLSGVNPAPGDRELVEFLSGAGMRARLGDDPGADLLIVTRTAAEEVARAAAARPVPLLAWGHLVPLGMASASAVPLSLDSIHVSATGHPAAADLDGGVVVYRGRSKLTVSDPPADAAIVARDPESGRAAIAVLPAGSRLVDGTAAPAPRATFFLAADGFAPWLVTPEARALLLAIARHLLSSRPAGG